MTIQTQTTDRLNESLENQSMEYSDFARKREQEENIVPATLTRLVEDMLFRLRMAV